MISDNEALKKIEAFFEDASNSSLSLKWLCRELKVNVSKAVSWLTSFAKEHEEAKCIYTLSGLSEDGSLNLMVVKEEKLEEAKAALKEVISCDLFAIHQSSVRKSSELWAPLQQQQNMLEKNLSVESSEHLAANYSCISCALCKRVPRSTRPKQVIKKRLETREDIERRDGGGGGGDSAGIDVKSTASIVPKKSKAKVKKEIKSDKDIQAFFNTQSTQTQTQTQTEDTQEEVEKASAKEEKGKGKGKTAAATKSKGQTTKEKKQASKGTMKVFTVAQALEEKKGASAKDVYSAFKNADGEEWKEKSDGKRRKRLRKVAAEHSESSSSSDESEDTDKQAKKSPSKKEAPKKKSATKSPVKKKAKAAPKKSPAKGKAAAKKSPSKAKAATKTSSPSKAKSAPKKSPAKAKGTPKKAVAKKSPKKKASAKKVTPQKRKADSDAEDDAVDPGEEEAPLSEKKSGRKKRVPDDQTTLEQFSPRKGTKVISAKRRKTKKVTKTYLDEEGFIVDEVVEVTDSEASDEPIPQAAAPLKPKSEKKKVEKVEEPVSKKSRKQASISSFFGSKK